MLEARHTDGNMHPLQRVFSPLLLLATISVLTSARDIQCSISPESDPMTCKLVCRERGYQIGYCDFGICACAHFPASQPPPGDAALAKSARKIRPMQELPKLEFTKFRATEMPSAELEPSGFEIDTLNEIELQISRNHKPSAGVLYDSAVPSISLELQPPATDFSDFAMIGDLEPPKFEFEPFDDAETSPVATATS